MNKTQKNKKKGNEGISKNARGITLIALIVTIIVLIILAGITLNLLMGDNGILTRAKGAKELQQKAQATELLKLKMTACQMESIGEKGEYPTLAYLAAYLNNDEEVEYVEASSHPVATSLDETPYISWDKIYTKFKKYSYEFEINSSFQVAVNGEQVSMPTGYMKIPTETLNITENGDNIDVTNYAKVNVNVQNNSSYGESSIISDVSFTAAPANDRIYLNVSVQASDSSKIIGYHAFAVKADNENLIYSDISDSNSLTITSLEKNTNYNVYVVAYDINNEFRTSEVVNVLTRNDIVKLIPILTSNTSGTGTAFISGNRVNNRNAYEAFDGIIPPTAFGDTQGYLVMDPGSTAIGYDFGENNSCTVLRIVYYGHPNDANVGYTSFTLQYSDNGTSWTDVQTFSPVNITSYSSTSDLAQTFNVTNEVSQHRYWRINGTNGDSGYSGLLELEFWGN